MIHSHSYNKEIKATIKVERNENIELELRAAKYYTPVNKKTRNQKSSDFCYENIELDYVRNEFINSFKKFFFENFPSNKKTRLIVLFGI